VRFEARTSHLNKSAAIDDKDRLHSTVLSSLLLGSAAATQAHVHVLFCGIIAASNVRDSFTR
jgi:hypothetical protein